MATRYRKVDPRMWGDAKFRALSDDARMVFMYLLTAPEVTALPGFVVIGRAGLAEGIGWDEDLERLSRAFAELSAAGMAKADWRARLVILPNAPRYNEPESPNAIRSWRSHFDALPESPLRNEMLGLLRAFTEGLRPNLRETFADTFRLDERAPAEPLVEGSARVPEGLPKGSPEPLVEGSASPPEAPLSRVRATRDARVPAPAPVPVPGQGSSRVRAPVRAREAAGDPDPSPAPAAAAPASPEPGGAALGRPPDSEPPQSPQRARLVTTPAGSAVAAALAELTSDLFGVPEREQVAERMVLVVNGSLRCPKWSAAAFISEAVADARAWQADHPSATPERVAARLLQKVTWMVGDVDGGKRPPPKMNAAQGGTKRPVLEKW